MANKLPVKQGLSAPAVTTIPEKWDRQWFRSFITQFLVNADIRNAKSSAGILINPINVSGNVVTGSGSGGSSVIIGLTPIPPNTVLGNNTASTAEPVAINQAQLTALIINLQLNQIQAINNNTVVGNISGSSASPSPLTQAQLTSLITNLTLTQITNIANDTVLGNISGSASSPAALSQTQLTSLINIFTSGISGAVPASGGGTVNFLRADGTFSAPPSSSGANPTAKVGPTVVNGSATTFMRSDAAPPIDETQSYSWSNKHTFTPPTATGIAVVFQGLTRGDSVIEMDGTVATGSAGATFSATNKPGSAGTVQGWIPVTYDSLQGYIPIWN